MNRGHEYILIGVSMLVCSLMAMLIVREGYITLLLAILFILEIVIMLYDRHLTKLERGGN